MAHVEAIDYDPIKEVLGRLVSRNVLLRRLFYTALGALFLRQWHVRATLKRIARTDKIRDIFDAGSGFGQYTYLMGRLFPGARILALDVKPEQIEDCTWFTERVGQKDAVFQLGDLTTFARPDSFDLALSVDVMEHIADDETVFRNVHKSLRPGGWFVISTPRSAERSDTNPEFESVIGEHVRKGYEETEFIEKITRAGFEIEKLRRDYGAPWGWLSWMMLQRIPMRLLNISKVFFVVVIPWMLIFYLPSALFMWLDVHASGANGWGWLMVARKPK
jgi:SAM-dependent methyltransferase